MNKKKRTIKEFPFKIFLLSLIVLSPITLWAKGHYSNLNQLINNFEKQNCPVSVLIMRSRDNRVEYLYNSSMCISQLFSVGSITKILSATIFLKHPTIYEIDKPVFCNGKYLIKQNNKFLSQKYNIRQDSHGQDYFACWKKHGHVFLMDAIIHSCNIYFLTKAKKNPQKFYKELVGYWGLNKQCKLRFSNAYSPQIHTKTFTNNFDATMSAIGEGGNILASPLKIAQCFSAIYSSTPLLIPYLGKTRRAIVDKRIIMSRKNRLFLLASMSGVFKKGTLASLKIKNSRIKILGGKTGSGTLVGQRYATNGWNVLLIKINSIKYIVVTFVAQGNGSGKALKLSRIVLNEI